MSQQARQELYAWETQQVEIYETRCRTLEYELHQRYQEALSLRYFRDLQRELEEAEGAYKEKQSSKKRGRLSRVCTRSVITT